jgi:hypothetical protein
MNVSEAVEVDTLVRVTDNCRFICEVTRQEVEMDFYAQGNSRVNFLLTPKALAKLAAVTAEANERLLATSDQDVHFTVAK